MESNLKVLEWLIKDLNILIKRHGVYIDGTIAINRIDNSRVGEIQYDPEITGYYMKIE